MRCRRPLIPTSVVAAAAVAVLAAGCGGSSPPTGSAGQTSRPTDLAGEAVTFAACMRSHGLVRLSGPTGLSIGGPREHHDLARRTRSQLSGVQVCHARLQSPSARPRIIVRFRQPPGAGPRPALRVLHAHARRPELPRPRPRRSLHPPVRARPAGAPVPASDESVRERRAKLALDPQPTSSRVSEAITKANAVGVAGPPVRPRALGSGAPGMRTGTVAGPALDALERANLIC